MATPPHVPPKPPQQPDPKQAQREREEREARAKDEASAKEAAQRREKGEAEDDRHKGDEQKKPKYPILPEGQAYQLFYNGHKIVRDGDPPTQWLMMGRLPDGTAVVQTPLTPELEKKLKEEGKFYVADGVTEEPPPPPPVRNPL